MLSWWNSQDSDPIPRWALVAQARAAKARSASVPTGSERLFEIVWKSTILGFLATIALAWAGGF